MASIVARLLRACALLGVVGTLAWVNSVGAQEPAKEKDTGGPVPEFLPAGGVFTQTVTLRLEKKSRGSVVRYTLDGSEPTAQSPAFANPLELRASALVRARIFEASLPAGPVVAQTYTLLGDDAQKFTSNLPLVIISTFGREVEHVDKIRASIRFIDAGGSRTSLLSTPDFDGRGDIFYRGKSSLRYLKRSYGIKLRDEAGKPRSASILGFPKESDWILYGPYPDKTLLRDVLAYELSNDMGHYASRTRFVEVFVNESSGRLGLRQYMGVFVLEEKVKRDSQRVALKKLGTNDNAEPNITGGYIFKKDHLDQYGNVEPSLDGRPNFGGGNSGSRYGYPTGPGGFPGDPKGFLPPIGGSRETTRGWETSRTTPSGTQPPPIQSAPKSWLDGVKSFFGGDNPPPPAEAPSRNGRSFDDLRPPPGAWQSPQDRDGRSRRGVGEPVVIWDAGTGRRISNRSFEEAFYTSKRNEFIYVEPGADEITRAQKTWLRNYLNEFERVLYGSDFRDPTNGYAAYIDVVSFIDHHLIVEVTKNIDGFRFSTYYSKERAGKMRMEPIWDWNLSFGNANGKQGQIAEYWYWPQLDDSQYAWFRRLFDDPDFGQRYVDRYAELRSTVFSLSNINARIERHVAELNEAQQRNFKRWPILGRRVWPNTYVGQSYEDEIAYLKGFIRKRLDWIDRQFVAAPSVLRSEAGAKGAVSLILSASAGKVYFTLDGSDPRAPGGGVSPKAKLYTAPIPWRDGGKLFARASLEDRWSAPLHR